MFTRAFICSHVNLIFSYRPLARSRAAAPRDAFHARKDPRAQGALLMDVQVSVLRTIDMKSTRRA
jgi:hypothetical protein